ncbi:hypothetical protein ACU8KI_05215 [Rhizobium leguminosarum]
MLKILLKSNRNIHAKRVATWLAGTIKVIGLEAPLRDAHRRCDGGKAQAIL